MKFSSPFRAAYAVLCSFALFGAAQSAFGHGVQVAYGTTPTGFVRIYIEHWHGDLSLANLAPPNNINVTVTTSTGSSTFDVNASGTVNNTLVGNLPGLVGAPIVLATGSGSNAYGDWGYWDFAPGSCNQPITIRVNRGNSVIFQASPSNLYPVTITGQTFTDLAGPVITAPDITVPGGCTGTNVNFAVSVQDDCDANPSVTYSKASGSFFPVGTTPVTVTATDNTGKTSVKTFNVIVFVNDTTPPTLTVPAAISVNNTAGQCGAIVNFTTSASDNCSTATVVSTPASGTFFGKGTTTVTSVATDGSGNQTTKTFTVTVVDNEAPTITAPGDIVANTSTGACSAPVNFAASASDNCPGVSISYSHAPGSTFVKGLTVVTATATDAVGRTASTTFNVTVVDVQPPTITTAASSATVACNAGSAAALSAWLASNGGAAAADACGVVTWSNNFAALSDGCGATGAATVIFTATDGSGNRATTTATFTVVDTTAPTIVVPASSVTIECSGASTAAAISGWLASNGGASATDACGAVTWSNNFTALNGACGSTGAATVTFVASDACGNVATTIATITVKDTTAPTVAAAASQTVNSDGAGNLAALSAWLASNGGASATDTCSAVTWSNNHTAVSDGCGATGATTVTFTATDACGNAASTTATFTIIDITPPTVVAASALTVESDGAGNLAALNAWLASNGGASATDAGGAVTWTNNFAAVSDGCGTTGAATVTFTATDTCGNAATTTATFTIKDTQSPTINSAAANLVVETDGAGNTAALSAWLASNGGATASDVGSAVSWSHNYTPSSLSNGCGATGTATVTFTATDACGNASSSTATFTIVDTTKPVLSSNVRNISPNEKPITFTVSSTDVGGSSTPTITSVTATRVNGSGKTLDKTGPYKHSVSGNKVTIEISGGVDTVWTISTSAVDECGNTATATFVVNVVNPTLTK